MKQTIPTAQEQQQQQQQQQQQHVEILEMFFNYCVERSQYFNLMSPWSICVCA